MDNQILYELRVPDRLKVDFERYCETEGFEMGEMIIGFMEYCLEKPEKVKSKVSTKH